jgi:tetratricopeptide (TPR) repeat protein
LKKGQYDLALSDLNRAIQLEPDLAEAFHYRGLRPPNVESYDAAFATISQTLGLQPNNPNALFGRATDYYITNGKFDQAIADYDQVIRLDPQPGASQPRQRAISARALRASTGRFRPRHRAQAELRRSVLQPRRPPPRQRRLLPSRSPISARRSSSSRLHSRPFTTAAAPTIRTSSTSSPSTDFDQVLKLKPNDAAAFVNRLLDAGRLGTRLDSAWLTATRRSS